MTDPSADPILPIEFDLSDIAIAETDAISHVDSLNEVLQMRDALVRSEQRLFQMEQDVDQRDRELNRLAITSMQIAVELVDELERMVDAAQSNQTATSTDFPNETMATDDEAASDCDAWMRAFQRLSNAAAHTLKEQLSIVRIPLQGKDLRELKVDDHPIARWIAVKNGSEQTGRIVDQVIRGLWMRSLGDKWVPIQRGEVTTKRS